MRPIDGDALTEWLDKPIRDGIEVLNNPDEGLREKTQIYTIVSIFSGIMEHVKEMPELTAMDYMDDGK